MGGYKAVIYDIDGTLLDTLKMNMVPLQRIILEELGIQMPYGEVVRFASMPGLQALELLKIPCRDKVYARWVTYVNAFPGGATAYSGVEEALRALEHAGLVQAVVSAKMHEQYNIDFVSKGLDRFMKAAVLAEDTERHKPDPEPLLRCLELLGLEACQALYVGDALSDYEAAKSAGVDFGYAAWGSLSSQGIDAPAWVFHAPCELTSILP